MSGSPRDVIAKSLGDGEITLFSKIKAEQILEDLAGAGITIGDRHIGPSHRRGHRSRPSVPESGPATSGDAARYADDHGVTGRALRKVFALLNGGGGFTDAEGVEFLAMNPNTYRPRRWDLFHLGLVVPSSERRGGSTVWYPIWKLHAIDLDRSYFEAAS